MSRTAGELVGTFDYLAQSWDRDDGYATIIGRVVDPSGDPFAEPVTIKGTVLPGTLRVGLTYRFWGRWTTHPKYGDQFWFETFTTEKPAGEQGVVAYLQQCDGVGPVTAQRLWDLYGPAAIETLRERPGDVVGKVPRFSEEQIAAASERLRKYESTERAKLDLMGLLHRGGVPKKVSEKAIEEWGVQAAEMIRRNPYLLMRFRGIGFLKTDKLWIEFGLPPARLKRQALCCWYSIARNSDGHTWFPQQVARSALMKSLSGADARFDDAMRLSRLAGMLSIRDDGVQTWIAERSKDTAEGRVARFVEEARLESEDRRERGLLLWPSLDDAAITDHQRDELAKALRGVVAILAGSPGTGKTYCAAQIIKRLADRVGLFSIAAAAPTGKAAVRLTESLDKIGVKLKASTVHSLLGVDGNGDGGFRFNHDENNPLSYKVVLIDESSMLDTSLMASLLAARGMGTHYLFLGDPNQLAPVGHGAPLRDMLLCPESVPAGVLTEIQRNAGRIVQVCSLIRDRKAWQPSPRLDLDSGENLLLLDRLSPEDQIETLESLLRKFQADEKRTYDPIWDVQVIVAVNKKGPLCRKVLNERLQKVLNTHGQAVAKSPFRVGDKIVNTKNGYLQPHGVVHPDAVTNTMGFVYVANGEQAEVIEAESSRMIARLTAPPRTVVIGRRVKSDDEEAMDEAMAGAGGEEGEAAENTEGKTSTGCSWEHAYTISSHKSQGSEWPVIIVMLDDHNAARMTCSRQWLFTAISRGKGFCVLIGTKERADEMCRRDALFQRKTFLRERIELLRLAAINADGGGADGGDGVGDNNDRDSQRQPVSDADEFDELLEGVLL